MIKKIILILLSVLTFFTVSLHPFLVNKVYAQDTQFWYMQSFPQWYIKVYDTGVSPPDEIFGERYTAAQVQWVIYGLISAAINASGNAALVACIMDGGNLVDCLRNYPLASAASATPYVFNDNTSYLSLVFSDERSLSGVNYVRQKVADLKLVPEAQAQGFGFGVLSPLQTIWKAFRNVMYGFFVIITIVMAFMIMFRMKLSAQTVVTIQSALPKIVITMILVTFSYAIAGFMIDLIYVAIGIVALIFTSSGIVGSWSTLFKLLTDGPSFDGTYTGGIGLIVFLIPIFIVGGVAALFGATGIAGIVGSFGSQVIAGIVGIILFAGLAIWVVVASIKTLFLIIKTYFSILLLVIFSPFYIGIGPLVPGAGFGAWAKNLLSKLIVFPIMGIIFVLILMFLSGVDQEVANQINNTLGVGIMSPFTCPPDQTCYGWYPPLSFGVQSGSYDPLPMLWLFAAVGLLAVIPAAGDLAKGIGAAASGKGDMSAALGGAIGGSLGALTGAYGVAGRLPGAAARSPLITAAAAPWHWGAEAIRTKVGGGIPPAPLRTLQSFTTTGMKQTRQARAAELQKQQEEERITRERRSGRLP